MKLINSIAAFFCRSHIKKAAYLESEGGSVTILAIIFFVLIVGIGGLAVDLGRIYNAHSQFQTYVDEVTLNAAAELDRSPDAITRAIRAAVGDAQAGPLISDTQDYTDPSDKALSVSRMIFLQSLANDPDPTPALITPVAGDTVLCTWDQGTMSCNNGLTVAEASKLANFVAVTAVPKPIKFVVLPIVDTIGVLFGAPSITKSVDISGQATAGFEREVCNTPPLMFCNPYENPVAPYGGPFTPIIGQQIKIKLKGPNSSWGPGNFGFLQTAAGLSHPECTGGGKNLLRCLLAVVNPATQCIKDTVDTEPGQGVAVHVGLNVRFDIFSPPLASEKTNPSFRPARNVTKGKKFSGNNCSANGLSDATGSRALPRDPCIEAGSCPTNFDGTARFGDGVTASQLDTWWNDVHHVATGFPGTYAGNPTRYEVYRYETNTNNIIDYSPAEENGTASCASNWTDPGAGGLRRLDRRVLTVAVINCLEQNIQGQTDNVKVLDFAEMFLTEPVDKDDAQFSGDAIYAEMLGVLEPNGDDGILHEFPVLYR